MKEDKKYKAQEKKNYYSINDGNIRFDIGTMDVIEAKCVYIRARMYHLPSIEDGLKFSTLKREIEGIVKSNKFFRDFCLIDYKVSDRETIKNAIRLDKLKPEYTEVEISLYPYRGININSIIFEDLIKPMMDDISEKVLQRLDIYDYKNK